MEQVHFQQGYVLNKHKANENLTEFGMQQTLLQTIQLFSFVLKS